EVLLETAGGAEQRPQTTRVILAAIDELLDHAGLTQPYLGAAEEHRLRLIADRVVSWWPDGSVSGWRQSLESRLAAAGRRRSPAAGVTAHRSPTCRRNDARRNGAPQAWLPRSSSSLTARRSAATAASPSSANSTPQTPRARWRTKARTSTASAS